ncbi:16S rRNA (uracil1498-N3)-methyltransferase [Hasllibacter halocynthiae]|uniref:Ribosomal RNA small subunit methyltransferase E n=1 Tax=Hasllibacter halocynthiae TaxID=595589 RepID=A0A2T0X3R4_9RHOB|nr:16S rRNA (uracil(1498)-N(3))-methyltransferase [Hasllibacter halocynthiae]PRY93596.1 16S rRNA (uracil1498-N3)-methyltransferase [Hasllibacter halocynthiae]
MGQLRLFLDRTLAEGEAVALEPPQAHWLFNVMRAGEGAPVEVFDGRTGVYDASVAKAGRKGALLVGARTGPVVVPPDLWLMFAPVKKARTDFIAEKATELGARRILPVRTDHTNSERVRADRLRGLAVEAAEQCGGSFVPEVAELAPLAKLLEAWPTGRALVFCDETAAGFGGRTEPPGWDRVPPGPAAVLIGPEGGFSPPERDRLRRIAHPVGLGPRVLRADTAAVAALTLWQARHGDWQGDGT